MRTPEEQFTQQYNQMAASPASSEGGSCCACFVHLWHKVQGGAAGHGDTRSASLAQQQFQHYQYQAPSVSNPSRLDASPPSEEELLETESGRLLPKTREPSALLEAVRNHSGTASQDVKRRSTADPQPSTSGHQQAQASGSSQTGGHRRVRSVGDGKHKKGKGLSGGSAAEVLSSTATTPAAAKAGGGGGGFQDEDDDFCATCLEAYTSDNPKIFTECGHHFHMPCIYAWLERKDTCPMCGSAMNAPGLA